MHWTGEHYNDFLVLLIECQCYSVSPWHEYVIFVFLWSRLVTWHFCGYFLLMFFPQWMCLKMLTVEIFCWIHLTTLLCLPRALAGHWHGWLFYSENGESVFLVSEFLLDYTTLTSQKTVLFIWLLLLHTSSAELNDSFLPLCGYRLVIQVTLLAVRTANSWAVMSWCRVGIPSHDLVVNTISHFCCIF